NELDILSDFDKFLKSLHNPRITLSDLAYLGERVQLAAFMDANQSTSVEVRYLRRFIKGVSVQGRSENYPMMGKWELKDGGISPATRGITARMWESSDMTWPIGCSAAWILSGKKSKLPEPVIGLSGFCKRRPECLAAIPT